MKEHPIKYQQIYDLLLRRYRAFMGDNIGLFDVIIGIAHKGVQRAVNSVIVAGLNFDGYGGKTVVIVDQEIDLALAAVAIIEQLITMGTQGIYQEID